MDRFPSILSFDKEIFKKQGPPSVQLTENQEQIQGKKKIVVVAKGQSLISKFFKKQSSNYIFKVIIYEVRNLRIHIRKDEYLTRIYNLDNGI